MVLAFTMLSSSPACAKRSPCGRTKAIRPAPALQSVLGDVQRNEQPDTDCIRPLHVYGKIPLLFYVDPPFRRG